VYALPQPAEYHTHFHGDRFITVYKIRTQCTPVSIYTDTVAIDADTYSVSGFSIAFVCNDSEWNRLTSEISARKPGTASVFSAVLLFRP